MIRRFRCVACGKCCVGWLPLTVKDALAQAGRFPLGVVWTPIRQASKDFAQAEALGHVLKTRDRKTLAIRIIPTAYIPQSMSCPALGADNLCSIQADKPSRCKAMPFFPYRDEDNQTDLLIPRPKWECDVSAEAPAVYQDKTILDRADFDAERADLLAQAPAIRAYAQWVLAANPTLSDTLAKASMKQGGGHVALSFASLLRQLKDVDRPTVAAAQFATLNRFAETFASEPRWADYRKNYQDWAWEMERLT